MVGWPATASADERPDAAPRLARLEVTLWPEYDRPGVLVMLQGWVAADVILPAAVALPMPARAGKPHAVAQRAPDGTLLTAAHMIDVQGDWATVKVLTDGREVRLEYYAELARTGPERRYAFEWPGGLDVAQVTYEVMRPIDATDLSVQPPPKSQGVGHDELTYYRGDLGPKTQRDTFSIRIIYTKTTSTLTAGALAPPTPSAGQMPPAGSAPGGTAATPAGTPSGPGGPNLWLLALMGALGAGLGGLWVFILTRRRQGKRSS